MNYDLLVTAAHLCLFVTDGQIGGDISAHVHCHNRNSCSWQHEFILRIICVLCSFYVDYDYTVNVGKKHIHLINLRKCKKDLF